MSFCRLCASLTLIAGMVLTGCSERIVQTQLPLGGSCLGCHDGITDIHPAFALACVDCHGGNDAVPLACELADPDSVRACVAAVQALGCMVDVLLCNAGIMALPTRELKLGHELQFLTNHVGHFILVTGLLNRLSDGGRVVMLSSGAHHRAPPDGIQFEDLSFQRGYSPWAAYGQSKLANLLFARSLARRLAGTRKTANSLHPGVIATNLTRHMNLAMRIAWPVATAIAMKNVHEGAATQCYVAAHPSLDKVSGEYFADCNVAKPSRHGSNDAMADRLWQVTEDIVAKL